MTRLKLEDLPPRMKRQALKQIAEQEKAKKGLQDPANEQPAEKKLKGGNKFNAEKQTVILHDGKEHKFDSKKEARVYNDLLVRLKAGEISNLRLQVPYTLVPKQIKMSGKAERAVSYVADFVYEENGKVHVVDVKGLRKGSAYAVFVIKRKLMLFVHHIEVEEV